MQVGAGYPVRRYVWSTTLDYMLWARDGGEDFRYGCYGDHVLQFWYFRKIMAPEPKQECEAFGDLRKADNSWGTTGCYDRMHDTRIAALDNLPYAIIHYISTSFVYFWKDVCCTGQFKMNLPRCVEMSKYSGAVENKPGK